MLGIATEIVPIERALADAVTRTIGGIVFTEGRLSGRRVVAGRSGIGKVNTAIAATMVIEHFTPAALFFSGTAGALDPALGPGDVIIASAIAQHDVGLMTPSGLTRRPTRSYLPGGANPLFFPAADELLEAARRVATRVALKPLQAHRAPVVREATIVTGDVFVADTHRRDELRALGAAAVEMEGGAMAQVCWHYKVPCLVVRSITDSADGSASDRYQQFLAGASENAAMLVTAAIVELGAAR